jgi:GH24 family phage-related lysozyme (muramidase)
MADQLFTPLVQPKNKCMALSAAGLAFIADAEHFMPTLYDTDGGGHCTIGYGHLVHHGKCDGQTSEQPYQKGISADQGQSLLLNDVAPAARAVDDAVQVELTQNQFDALVSFAFNVGVAGFRGSTLLTKLNQGKYDEVPDEMRKWVHSSGKRVQGLVNRREREINLFNSN